MTFLERIAEIVPVPSRSPQKPELWLSKIGWGEICERRLAYPHHGLEETDPTPPKKMRAADLGYAIEDRVIDWMAQNGIWTASPQKRVEWHGLHGRIDRLVSDGQGQAVMDIKSMKSRSFREFRKHGLSREGSVFTYTYRGQIQTYTEGLQLQRGYIVAVDRDTADIHAVLEPRDDVYLSGLKEIVDRVRLTVVPEDSPRGTGLDRGSVECRYCGYRTACWETE